LHHTPATVAPHGYDLLGALAVAHALLEPAYAHALIASAEAKVDAAFLASLSAPFDWKEAERRVRSSASPTN
jgi:uncharacterized protein YcnI